MRRISGVTVGIAVVVLVLLGLVGDVAADTLGEVPRQAKLLIWAGLAVLTVAAVWIELYRHRREEPTPAATGLGGWCFAVPPGEAGAVMDASERLCDGVEKTGEKSDRVG